MWTLFFDIFCPLYFALLDMDDARGTFVTFKKLFNSCRHELEEWWSMMDILAKILKLNVLMRKKCLLYIVPTSFFHLRTFKYKNRYFLYYWSCGVFIWLVKRLKKFTIQLFDYLVNVFFFFCFRYITFTDDFYQIFCFTEIFLSLAQNVGA